nr:hypothetical protein [Tanacetum cinerariifolium]
KEDGIFIKQDKYIAEILKKFNFLSVKTASTPIETQKPLVKDEEGADVDVYIYSKELASPKQTAIGKDTSNSLIVDTLLKTIWLSIHHVIVMKHWLFYSKRLLIVDFLNAQVIHAKRTAWNEFSYSMAPDVIYLETVIINAQVDDLSSHTNQYTSPALTQKVFANMRRVGKGFSRVKTPLFATMLVQPQADVEEDDVELEQDKIAQALEILKLKQRVKKLEKKRKSKSSGGCIQTRGRIEAIDADEDITMVDVETQVDLGVELQGRKDNGNAAIKDASDPTVFDDEEVTMTIAQTLIKMKAKKARLLNEQMAKRLHDEENVIVEQMQEKNLENIRKYQSLKRKPISVAQARKNMIVYLKNMAGYKMEHFKGITYDKVRPIFKREYNKVQTLFKPDKDEEPIKKRVVGETLLQESFKKLKVVKVSGSHSTQDIPTDDPKEISKEDVKNMLKIIPVTEFKIKALQRLVKEKFNSAVPTVDKEKALWVELKRLFEHDANDVIWNLQRYMHYPIMWKLHSNCRVHQVSSTTRRHDMYMLIEKDYPLSNGVMTLMLSTRLQVKEDSKMARDLVMKIFIKANQPKSRSLDTSSK